MFKLSIGKLFAFTISSFITGVGLGWYGKCRRPACVFTQIKKTEPEYSISPTGALLSKQPSCGDGISCIISD